MGLIHMVTIVEAVVIFVINTYRSLLVCTIELAVRGTLEMMIGAVRGVGLSFLVPTTRLWESCGSEGSGTDHLS